MPHLTGARKDRSLRVLHVPNCVGGHPQQLARAEREIGLESWAVCFQPSKFGYVSDEFLWRETDKRWQKEWKRWSLLARALAHYDVIHFNFGQSFTPPFVPNESARRRGWLYSLVMRLMELKDLPLLKWAGKGVAMTFQGDDARQGNVFQRLTEYDLVRELGPDYYTPASDARKQRRIADIARHADCIYALNPDLLHVLPAPARFLPYAHIDLRAWPLIGPNPDLSRPPLVLHAPTHRGAKGTGYVVEAVRRLQQEGVRLDFQMVENLPRTEARKLYERADLLVDQLLFGWYGGLAVELMALGKPVLAHVRPGDLRCVPEQMRADLPVIDATPDTVYAVLKDWLTARRGQLAALGHTSRLFVEKWHDPLKIATEIAEDYRRIMLPKMSRRRAA